MLSKHIGLIRRIASMHPEEIRFRAAVFVRQRIDARRALRGGNPLDPGRADHAPATAPRFFFDPNTIRELAEQVRKRLPDEVSGVLETAARVKAGSFDLLGYRGLSFGTDGIDWSLDAVHGIRAPKLPWYRVPYLDFRQSGDHKVTWELSRHQHLMILARAWLYSGDTSYLRTLERLWFDWRRSNPYPLGINWASTLEVAFRCMSWMWVDHWIADSPDVSDEFRQTLKQGIGESATYIESYISTYFAPNTHLLGEALVMFLVGTLYPEFRPSQRWRDSGWKIVLQDSEHQVRSDGFHFEQSVYYHVYALEMLLYARLIASRNGIAVPEAYDQVLIRMAEGLAAIGAAGQAPRFGDDDGGRLFDGRRNRTEYLLDPLATVAAVYGRGCWKGLAGNLREESIWLLGVDGVRAFDAIEPETPAAESRAFRASGYYVLGAHQSVAVVDAGPHGWGRGGHGHADALSLQLIADGQAWLTDPGTCSYPMETPDRNRFRSTAAHNTLEVDGVSQADPFHSFGWQTHPAVQADAWHDGRRITVFSGRHDGYARLPEPVIHHRQVIGWRDGMWFIRDVAAGTGTHRLDVRWHLSPDCTLTADSRASWIAVRSNSGGTLRLCVPEEDTTWTGRTETAQWSPAYGIAVGAPVLRLSCETELPAECATLLAIDNPARPELRRLQEKAATGYAWRTGDGWRLLIFGLGPGPWNFHELRADAQLLAIEIAGDALIHVFSLGSETVTEWTPSDAVAAPVSEHVVKSLRQALDNPSLG